MELSGHLGLREFIISFFGMPLVVIVIVILLVIVIESWLGTLKRGHRAKPRGVSYGVQALACRLRFAINPSLRRPDLYRVSEGSAERK